MTSSADDRKLLADLEARNVYPCVERHLRAGARTYTVTLWPPGAGQAAVTTSEHATAGAALTEAAVLAGR